MPPSVIIAKPLSLTFVMLQTLKVKSPPPVITAEEDSSSTKELGSYDSVQQKLHKTLPLQLTDIPTFLTHLIPKVCLCVYEDYINWESVTIYIQWC